MSWTEGRGSRLGLDVRSQLLYRAQIRKGKRAVKEIGGGQAEANEQRRSDPMIETGATRTRTQVDNRGERCLRWKMDHGMAWRQRAIG